MEILIVTKIFLSYMLKYKITGLNEVKRNYFNTFENSIKFVAYVKRFLTQQSLQN